MLANFLTEQSSSQDLSTIGGWLGFIAIASAACWYWCHLNPVDDSDFQQELAAIRQAADDDTAEIFR